MNVIRVGVGVGGYGKTFHLYVKRTASPSHARKSPKYTS